MQFLLKLTIQSFGHQSCPPNASVRYLWPERTLYFPSASSRSDMNFSITSWDCPAVNLNTEELPGNPWRLERVWYHLSQSRIMHRLPGCQSNKSSSCPVIRISISMNIEGPLRSANPSRNNASLSQGVFFQGSGTSRSGSGWISISGIKSSALSVKHRKRKSRCKFRFTPANRQLTYSGPYFTPHFNVKIFTITFLHGIWRNTYYLHSLLANKFHPKR